MNDDMAWATIAAFLRGELDHSDDDTRADIAKACTRFDAEYGDGDDQATWDEYLCRVETLPA